MVERDKQEMDSCLESQLCKSTLLLAGSIIEAILVDFFLTFPKANSTPEQILGANLANLIDWAEQEGLISSRTKDISTIIRNYRNLIHPAREYRLKERVDIHSATVAANLVEIVIQEVADNYAKRLGYTAEQAIEKVKLDPSCESIFQHMIDKMEKVEQIKLFQTIPNVCDPSDLEAVIDSFIKLHNLLKSNVSEEIVKAEVTKVYNYAVHTSSKMEVLFYFRFFCDDLDILESDQKEAVMQYMLSLLENGNQEELSILKEWGVFRRFGKYFKSNDEVNFLRDTIFTRLKRKEDPEEDIFISVLEEACYWLEYELWKPLDKSLRERRWDKKAIRFADALDRDF